MVDQMLFPDTVEEFMEQYKIVDTEQIYTNGTEMVPIFRMKQWFEHKLERKTGKMGKWSIQVIRSNWSEWTIYTCSECGEDFKDLEKRNYCPNCGIKMEEKSNGID